MCIRASVESVAEEAERGALSMVTEMTVARCPDCGRQIELWPLLQVGEELLCRHCEADLEVVGLDPVELDWAHIPPAEDGENGDKWDDEG
jgi:alpha-aminoadipate carrier protein LysW